MIYLPPLPREALKLYPMFEYHCSCGEIQKQEKHVLARIEQELNI